MNKNTVVYPYIPNSVPEIKAEMLKAVGATDEMELYQEIPEALKLKRPLNLPEPILDEYSIKRHVEGILGKNKNTDEYVSFLGAGCSKHFVPAVVDEILGRGEFLTCYGAETWADHGKYQAFFEYCSQIAELVDMDAMSVPLYDGYQAMATSLCMANRINGRKKVLVPKTLSSDAKSLIKNYTDSVHDANALDIIEVAVNPKTGEMDMADLERKLDESISSVLIENPSYLGFVEKNSNRIAELTKAVGAEFIVSVDPIALGVMEAPGQYGATMAIGDFQSLGLHMAAGGCCGGFIATPDDMKYMMEFKDIMNGMVETTVEGEYGWVPVLVERLHYAVREKGKEFTGTGTNLWSIGVGVYLALMGPKGMFEVGQTIMQNAQYAAKEIAAIKGVSLKYEGPFFKTFVVDFSQTKKTVEEINRALLDYKMFGGSDLACDGLTDCALYCVTEIHDKEMIDGLVAALKAIVE